METGRIGHHGQNVRGRVVWDIWSAIEVAVILHHSMEDWTVQLTKTNTLLYIISLVMNTTAQVWYTDLSVVHKSVGLQYILSLKCAKKSRAPLLEHF